MRNAIDTSNLLRLCGRVAYLPAIALTLFTFGPGCPGDSGLLGLLGDQLVSAVDAAKDGKTDGHAGPTSQPENTPDGVTDSTDSADGGSDGTDGADDASDVTDGADPSPDATVSPEGLAVTHSAPAPDDAGPFVTGHILVKFKDTVDDTQKKNIVAAENAADHGDIPHTGVKIIGLPAQASEKAAVHAFRNRPQVEFAELDKVLPANVVPNDPYFPSQWHLATIAAPTAWDTTAGSSSVIIAILDSGCDPTHPDLAPQYVAGWNIYSNNSNTSDVYGHGTAVAGTAAAAGNNASGVASVAWNCRIMPVRVTDTSGSASLSALASGLTWAADHGARVANISFMATNYSTVTSGAQYFESKGGVVTISAGNYSTFDSSADNPDVLTVSATTSNDSIASWSNTGNNIDLAAPGDYIYTTNNGGGYGQWSGTSFSAPVVAGVAGLVISANPGLSSSQIQQVLKNSADDLGAAGWDASYGWGRVNAARAVALALTTGTPAPDTTPPVVSIASPTDGASVSGTLSVQVNATDNASVASVSLSIDGAAPVTDTSAPYSFTWTTNNVANGAHTLQAVAKDSAGNTASGSLQVIVSNVVDTNPPAVSITAPTAGAKVSNTVSVAVAATDDVGVTKVALYVDGSLTASSTTAPFTTKWNARKAKAGTHTLQCTAYDAAGNSATSAAISVTK